MREYKITVYFPFGQYAYTTKATSIFEAIRVQCKEQDDIPSESVKFTVEEIK